MYEYKITEKNGFLLNSIIYDIRVIQKKISTIFNQ